MNKQMNNATKGHAASFGVSGVRVHACLCACLHVRVWVMSSGNLPFEQAQGTDGKLEGNECRLWWRLSPNKGANQGSAQIGSGNTNANQSFQHQPRDQ